MGISKSSKEQSTEKVVREPKVTSQAVFVEQQWQRWPSYREGVLWLLDLIAD